MTRSTPQYRGKSSSPPYVEANIARFAARQNGVVTRSQLLELGLGRRAIDHRLTNGRLHRLYPGVYGVGFRPSAPLSNAMAAVLACGPDAALSHRSAADMWRILSWHGTIEVTTLGKHDPKGVHVHHTRALSRYDRTKLWDVPVTIVSRTLIDLCDVLDEQALTRAANEALVRRLVTKDALADRIAASPGRRAMRLAAFAATTAAPTRSQLEDRFQAFVKTHRLPQPLVNQVVAGYEVDCHWPEQRLVAELDGRAFHDTPARFESDRDRDADLVAAGYRPIRITWKRLTSDPAREAQRLRAMLGAAP